MQKITWMHLCSICHRPIQSGRPTILFYVENPRLSGICHSKCGYSQPALAHFQMRPQDYLSEAQISFLVQFYPGLHHLPGLREHNRELRIFLAYLLREYPFSMVNVMESFDKCLQEFQRWSKDWHYTGDLETDFLLILGKIQKAAEKNPVGIEIDFRR
jgi:hypothetical protein